MFWGGDAGAVACGHSIHNKAILKVQEGGVGMLVYAPLIDQMNMDLFGKDTTELGHWVVVTLEGAGRV